MGHLNLNAANGEFPALRSFVCKHMRLNGDRIEGDSAKWEVRGLGEAILNGVHGEVVRGREESFLPEISRCSRDSTAELIKVTFSSFGTGRLVSEVDRRCFGVRGRGLSESFAHGNFKAQSRGLRIEPAVEGVATFSPAKTRP